MQFYLMRHGIAEEPDDARAAGRSEAERQLTKEGRERTARVARSFHKRVPEIEFIFHSPYARARQTAEIMALEFGLKAQEISDFRPHDSAEVALKKVGEKIRSGRTLFVGHEPHLSLLATLLLSESSSTPLLSFKKAGIAGFEWVSDRHSKLLFLLQPKFS